jgi:glutamate-ammonia-ligase adenylyltransferase
LAEVPAILEAPVLRWWERAAELPGFADAYAAAPAGLRNELPRVLASSEYAGAALIREPALLPWLAAHEEPRAATLQNREFEGRVARTDAEDSAKRELRVWRRREMLRIAWREIAGRASVPETLQALSQFADGCIRAAAAAAQRQLEPAYGLPRTARGAVVPFIVLGMGKLGGRELNFSSDVDLILLFGQDGTTDGPRSVDNQDYFQRLGRRFTALLDARTEDGFVFRVDLRLRPFGDSSPLVWSLAAFEDYLQEHGRDWERYAWIKARPIVGAEAYAATYRTSVRPFVYRRYLDFGVFESLRDMKALIAREVVRRDLDRDLKLGRGGIREIEFIAQSFQLVRGGNDVRLQNGSLLAVLPVLAGAKLLSAAVVSELTDAYLILRKAENAIQMIRDEQTHGLPEDAADRARLASACGSGRRCSRRSTRREIARPRCSRPWCSAVRQPATTAPTRALPDSPRHRSTSAKSSRARAFRPPTYRRSPQPSPPIETPRRIASSTKPVGGACTAYSDGCSAPWRCSSSPP